MSFYRDIHRPPGDAEVPVAPFVRTRHARSRVRRATGAAAWGAAFAAAFLFFSNTLSALDADKTVFQFNVQNWTRQTGLPADKVNTITQARDGYIWLGTQNGAVRFDGREFRLMPIDFSSAGGREVRELVAARDGGLWVAINMGRFGKLDGQSFSVLDDPRWVLPDLNANTVCETPDGEVWFGADLGLGRWSAQPAERIFDTSFQGSTLSMCAAPSGRVWIGTVERGLFYREDGKLHRIDDERLLSQNIFALAVDQDSRVWVGTGFGLLCYEADGTPVDIPAVVSEVKALHIDRHGVLWAGTTGMGLARLQDGQVTYLRKVNGLGSDTVTALFEDAEGSLWIGTQDGLSQLTDLKFPIFSMTEGLIGTDAIDIAPSRRGGLWITSNAGVSHLDGRNVTNYGGALFPNQYLRRVAETRSGLVLVGDGDKNIHVLNEGVVTMTLPNSDWPEAFAEDAESPLLAIGKQLFRLRAGGIEPYRFATSPGPDLFWINNLAVARDGGIWVATNGGIFRIQEGTWQHWSTATGLAVDRVHCLTEDADGSVWAGLPVGLVRIKDGELKHVRLEDGLFDDRIFAIVPDDHGAFWLSSGRGFFRIARTSLDAFADGRAARVVCDVFEGLESMKFTDRNDQAFSGCKTKDGRIWFPSPHGVVMIDPANYVINRVPPPVVIQQVTVNGVATSRADAAKLRVGQDRLEFFFTALSYISPRRVQIRYQLEGFDPTWRDAGERRSALYTNMRPGRYTFRIEACNADGVWNTAGEGWSFDLPPPYYQTGWFYAACSLAGVLLLFALYRWKIRRMQQQQEKLREQNDLLETKVAARTQELAREHALLRALLDNSPDQIYFKDTASRYLKASRAQAQNFGVSSPEDLIGKSDFDFFRDEHARSAFEDEKEILRTGRPVIGKVEKEVRPDGRVSWVLTSKMPLRNKADEIVGTFGISKDISAMKEAEVKLAELNHQFLETSRRAGMAEVATSVLHNVGNVLNSINVSAILVAEQVGASESVHLAKVCTLLRRHESELGPFFTAHPKGRQVLGFLETLSEHFAAEQATVGKEVEALRHNVDHVKEIIDMQQSYARISGVVETIGADELVEDALRMNSVALVRHDVNVIRDFQSAPRLTLEKHKVLQILVNLVRNAKYACDDSGRADKQMILRITSDALGTQIAVIDNGVGIPAENLSRIFSHGFTTRKNGHGFGLHSGALAAKELRGALAAHSAGPGQGATFILTLPLQREDMGIAATPPAVEAHPA